MRKGEERGGKGKDRRKGMRVKEGCGKVDVRRRV